MNQKFSSLFKNLSYSVFANGINTLVSIILVLFVPKLLGVKEYSYWQLYLFYASYVGFFHFGWADGVYLRFGGKNYNELDKRYFNTQFWLLTFMEVAVAAIISVVSILTISDMNKKVILIYISVCCVLQLPRTLLQYLLQTTNRISDYAKNYMLDRLAYAVLVIGMLLLGIRNYEMLICADLFARGFTLVLLCLTCRDIVFKKVSNICSGVRDAWCNIAVGSKLMVANIASLLITGIVRLAIENHWSIETFGKVSLTMTVSNLLMVFINAVSIVMYPVLKNTDETKLPEVYATLRGMLMIPVLGLLILYYPAKVLLSAWLPQYAESLKYMALLFPMCVFESKMSMLINTYLKALRKEKVIMWVNWLTVIITLGTTGVCVYICNSLTFSIASLAVLLGIRCMVSELVLARILHIRVFRDVILEFMLALIFIVVSWNVQSWWCMAIYFMAYIIYLFLHKQEMYGIWAKLKPNFIERHRY